MAGARRDQLRFEGRIDFEFLFDRGGVEDDEGGFAPLKGEEAGGRFVGEDCLRAGVEVAVLAVDGVESLDELIERRRLVELHVFAVEGVAATAKGVFSSVVKARNALQRVKKHEGLREFVRVAIGFVGGQETWLVVVINEGDHSRERVGAVGRRSQFLETFGELARGAAFANDVVDRVIERKIEQEIKAVIGGEAAHQCVAGVGDFAKHQEIGFAQGRRLLAHGPQPVRPEIAFHMPHGVDAKSIAIRFFHELLKGVGERDADFGQFRLEIVQGVELANDRFYRIVPVPDLAPVMEPVEAIEGRRRNAIGIDPAQRVTRAVLAKARPTRVIAGGDGAEVIEHDIEDDVEAVFVRGFGQVAQAREAAELRADGGEIERAVTMPGAGGVIDEHRRDPNRGGAQVLDVIEMLFNPLEIAAMNPAWILRAKASSGREFIIGRIAIRKPIRKNHINRLLPPIHRRREMGRGNCGGGEQ